MRKLFPLLVILLASCGGVKEKQVLVFYQSGSPGITQKLAEIVNVGTEKSIEVDTTMQLTQLTEKHLQQYRAVGNYEDGMLGIALDPKFRLNRRFYIYYSVPCEDSVQRLSRFFLAEDSLIMASEKTILEVPVQRETCCHSGGSIQFGPDGLLYLSTGDNTSSKESNGYTPIDERPGRGPFDAQKSSGNTHDLRGKVLRIKVEENGYSIPDGNLFPKDGSQGRPEIYAMGCRNPFRISIDHKTGYLYWGDVGPDSGVDSEQGPQSYDEWNQAREPGYFGWPYFVADNKAYPDFDFVTNTLGEYFDPENPVNDSPHNYGSKHLPPAKMPMIWKMEVCIMALTPLR